MVSEQGVINIMGQTCDKTITVRSRRNFDQSDPSAKDQITQERDVQFNRWNPSIGLRLAQGKQITNFGKQVIPDAIKRSLSG